MDLDLDSSSILALNDVQLTGEKITDGEAITVGNIQEQLRNAKAPFITELYRKVQSL